MRTAVAAIIFLLAQGCTDNASHSSETDSNSKNSTNTDTDTDSNTDTGAFGESDNDSDSEKDTETVSAGDGDTDTDSDTDTESEIASDTDSDEETDTDHDTDTGAGRDTDTAPNTWWKPTNDAPVHWHWQLSEDFVYPRDVLPNKTIFDIDGEAATAELVAQLHELGSEVKVICYFDAGVFEDYRSDADRFPDSIIGNQDEGWDGSYWLDIRQLDILMPLLRDRAVNWCLQKGFDAVEPDETEVWSNNPGFPITKEQNNAFNIAVAEMVHELGMSVGLKGNNTEAKELEPYFDWALTEQCWEYDECSLFRDSFGAAGKMVLNVEYNVNPNCASANAWHINSSLRDLDLMGPTANDYLYEPCIPDSKNTW